MVIGRLISVAPCVGRFHQMAIGNADPLAIQNA